MLTDWPENTVILLGPSLSLRTISLPTLVSSRNLGGLLAATVLTRNAVTDSINRPTVPPQVPSLPALPVPILCLWSDSHHMSRDVNSLRSSQQLNHISHTLRSSHHILGTIISTAQHFFLTDYHGGRVVRLVLILHIVFRELIAVKEIQSGNFIVFLNEWES